MVTSLHNHCKDSGICHDEDDDDDKWYVLLVSRFGLVEEDAIEVFHYYGFYLSSSFLM